jgi:zinc D-Ala-D-Ala carboxypeptidase
MNLSTNFTLEELTASAKASRNGWDNTPNETELANLKRLVVILEEVRALLGRPVIVSSGFRCKLVNDDVGSKDSSQHRIGCAADIKVPGMTPREVVKAIMASDIKYDQLIQEFSTPSGGGWTHISVANSAGQAVRKQVLIIDGTGTRAFT